MAKLAINSLEQFRKDYDAATSLTELIKLFKHHRKELDYIIPELWKLEEIANGKEHN